MRLGQEGTRAFGILGNLAPGCSLLERQGQTWNEIRNFALESVQTHFTSHFSSQQRRNWSSGTHELFTPPISLARHFAPNQTEEILNFSMNFSSPISSPRIFYRSKHSVKSQILLGFNSHSMEEASSSRDCTLLASYHSSTSQIENGEIASIDGCINELPDEILSKVLSVLDMKEAFRTRLLSRRWRYLWVPISHLKLDSSLVSNFKKPAFCLEPRSDSRLRSFRFEFVKKVDQLLNLLVTPQKLISFLISFNLDKEFASHFDEWIKFAVRMGSERIYIDFQLQGQPWKSYLRSEFLYFPCHLLPLGEGCSLKHLRLNECMLSPPPEFANRLNSLKSLSLSFVPVQQSDIDLILSGCINLERLELISCDMLDTLRISGQVPRLKCLSLAQCMTGIELNSINLKSFKYNGRLRNFSFSNVPQLAQVSLRIASLPKRCKDYLFERLGRDLPNLQYMEIFCFLEKVLPIPTSITKFGCLKQLKILVTASSACDLLEITNVLNASPWLWKLYISIGYDQYKGEKPSTSHHWGQPYRQLKEVLISRVCRRLNSLELAKCLLNNAVALRRMIVRTNHTIPDSPLFEKYKARPDQVYDLLLKEKANPEAKLIVV